MTYFNSKATLRQHEFKQRMLCSRCVCFASGTFQCRVIGACAIELPFNRYGHFNGSSDLEFISRSLPLSRFLVSRYRARRGLETLGK